MSTLTQSDNKLPLNANFRPHLTLLSLPTSRAPHSPQSHPKIPPTTSQNKRPRNLNLIVPPPNKNNQHFHFLRIQTAKEEQEMSQFALFLIFPEEDSGVMKFSSTLHIAYNSHIVQRSRFNLNFGAFAMFTN